MASIQINQLPLTTTAADAVILHMQDGGVDRSITKLSFLKELKALVDQNTNAVTQNNNLASQVGENTTKISDNAEAITLLQNWINRADAVISYNTDDTLVTGNVVNEFTATVVGTLPLANSVPAGGIIIALLSESNRLLTPSLLCSGADMIRVSTGTDTTLIFDNGEDTLLLISNGIDEWRL